MRVQLPKNYLNLEKEIGSLVNIRIASMPQSNDTQFLESDFYDLVAGVCNYDILCKKAGKESLLDNQNLIEKLRTRKV